MLGVDLSAAAVWVNINVGTAVALIDRHHNTRHVHDSVHMYVYEKNHESPQRRSGLMGNSVPDL